MPFCAQPNSWLNLYLTLRTLEGNFTQCLLLYVYMSLGQYIHITLVGTQYFEHYLSRNHVQTCETPALLTVIVLLILVASRGKCCQTRIVPTPWCGQQSISVIFQYVDLIYMLYLKKSLSKGDQLRRWCGTAIWNKYLPSKKDWPVT